MFKPTHCAWLVAAACALPSYAMNIQPDPQNTGGYVISAPDLAAVENQDGQSHVRDLGKGVGDTFQYHCRCHQAKGGQQSG